MKGPKLRSLDDDHSGLSLYRPFCGNNLAQLVLHVSPLVEDQVATHKSQQLYALGFRRKLLVMQPEHVVHTHQSRSVLGQQAAPVQKDGAFAATEEAGETGVVTTLDVPRLLHDDISAIGTWYLPGYADVCLPNSHGNPYDLWGFALWEMAKADAKLFGCAALLTLQKKRTIATTFDKVVYLDHKQTVYQSLCEQIRSDGTSGAGATALAMTLLSFIDVLEGKICDARSHINAVATMDCLHQLDEAQWRLVVWNDLRYAITSAAPPRLPYYIPPFLTSALATIGGAVFAEAQNC